MISKYSTGTVEAYETAGNLGLDFDITNITFSLIVVKWNGKVI